MILLPGTFCCFTHEAFEFPKSLLLQTIAILLAVLQVAAALGQSPSLIVGLRSSLLSLRRDWIALGVYGMLVSSLISTIVSTCPRTSLIGAHESYSGLSTIVGYGTLFFSARNLVRSRVDRVQLFTSVLLGAIIPIAYALVQYFQFDPLCWSGVSEFASQRRPFATLGHANHLASYLVIVLPILLGITYFQFAGRQRRHLLGFSLFIMLVAIVVVISLSRAAWLAMAVLCLLSICLLVRHRGIASRRIYVVVLASIFLMAGIITLIAAQPALRIRVLGIFELGSRGYLWIAGLRMFSDHPIFGTGLDTFAMNYGTYRSAQIEAIEWDITPAQAHNELIHVLATQGLLGGLSLMVLIAGVFRSLVSALRPNDESVAKNLAIPLSPPREVGDESDRRFISLVLLGSFIASLILFFFGFVAVACGSLLAALTAMVPVERDGPGKAMPARSTLKSTYWVFWVGMALNLVFLALNFVFSPSTNSLSDGISVWLVVSVIAVLSTGMVLRYDSGKSHMLVEALNNKSSSSNSQHKSGMPPHPKNSLLLYAFQQGILVLGLLGVVQIAEIFEASRKTSQGERLAQTNPLVATKCLDRAAELAPNWSTLATIRGAAELKIAAREPDAEEKRKHHRLAYEALQRVVELAPHDGHAHANFARCLAEGRSELAPDLARARKEFLEALRWEPMNPRILLDLGWVELRLGEAANAQTRVDAARRIHSNYGRLLALEADIAWRREDRARSIELGAAAIQMNWHADDNARREWHARHGSMLFQVGSFEQAILLGETMADRWPEWTAGYMLMAEARESLGQYDRARSDYARVLELDPHHPYARAGWKRLELPPNGGP
jgi:O-antigen ligase/tetratricopeptide (TPR) repeat protein